MAGPPVAMVRSQADISSWARGMLGLTKHWIRSSGAPCLARAARRMRLTSIAVALLAGWGEKITASRHLMALIAIATMVTTGLVTGSNPAMTPTGLAYLTMPFR